MDLDRSTGGSGKFPSWDISVFTPQSVNAFGGFRDPKGKTEESGEQVLRDARAVEAAGAFSVVLESIPRELAAKITAELRIPTIGIGAGPDCDGQVLVINDLLGLGFGHQPKFVRSGYCGNLREGSRLFSRGRR